MGVDVLRHTLAFGPIMHAGLNGAHGDRVSPLTDKYVWHFKGGKFNPCLAPFTQRLHGNTAYRHHTAAIAFSGDRHHARREVKLFPVQAGQF